MATDRDDGPVYYREIQKNSYLKRIPNEPSISKLIPLGNKKPPLKPMWTQLCVHNGRTPYLEQYPDSEHPSSLTHRPVWRACLSTVRHVTGSVRPRQGQEYDFLVDTDDGPVRMLAPDWETMQDWVLTLRNKLAELKIVSKGENVYCAPPAPPLPRAAARDPTSPLPPTPPIPPDRVPGIEITPTVRPITEAPTSQEPPINDTPSLEEPVDISDWEPFSTQPSTSQARERKSVAKICGQNICLDDSVLKREASESDEEFFAEIDRDGIEDTSKTQEFKQTVVIGDEVSSSTMENETSDRPSNITVIQVSNKEAPHTAIPVLGSNSAVFDFEFSKTEENPSFVNIVNTEVNVHNANDYGTVFSDNDDYGHLSLTTTVNLTAVNTAPVNLTAVTATPVNVTDQEGLYERLCMASTSAEPRPSPLPRRLKHLNKSRKSSLPNLDSADSTYEYLFLSQNNNRCNVTLNNSVSINENTANSSNNINLVSSTQLSNVNLVSTAPVNNINLISNASISNINTVSTSQVNNINSVSTTQVNNINSVSTTQVNNSNPVSTSGVHNSNVVNVAGSVEVNENRASENTDYRMLRSNVERSESQNSYDNSPRRPTVRRQQNNSPKRDGRTDKQETVHTKPMWKRGLTELSLLTRLKSLGNVKRGDSPIRQENESGDRVVPVASPAKVTRRSRTESRVDPSRRRSSSLSNESPPAEANRYNGISAVPPLAANGAALRLQPLRVRQARWLMSEQRRGAAHVAPVVQSQPPLFVDWNKQVWVARWGAGCGRWWGRCGDRVVGVGVVSPRDASHAMTLLQRARPHPHARTVDILFHRVPMGQIYVINKRDKEAIGIKLDGECNVVSVEPNSPARRAGLPPPGRWAVTEVNNRTLNLVKGGEDEMNSISLHGTEVSIIVQPSMFVKKLRTALKGSKSLLGLR